MLKRLRFKASLPALISGRARSISSLARNNDPSANIEKRLNKTRHNYIISSSKRVPTVQLVKLHTAMDSPESLEFPRHEIDVIERLKTSMPSTAEANDDFDELGPSVSGGTDSGSDLGRKKPKGRELSKMFLYSGSWQAPKTSPGKNSPVKLPVNWFPTEQDKCHPGTHSNLEGQNGALRSKTKAGKQGYFANNNKKHTSSLFISIDNVPRSISPLELREAISVYGEILSSFMKVGEDGRICCHVKFKNLEAKARALAARWITVKSSRLPIRGLLESVDYISIRISNVSMETTEVAIHSICKSHGDVFGLARTREGAADVVFRVKDVAVSHSIVKHLNDVVIDDCQWSAKLLPELDPIPATNTSDSQQPVGSQINRHLESFRNQFNMQRIYLEDLENLHDAVLHLKESPDM